MFPMTVQMFLISDRLTRTNAHAPPIAIQALPIANASLREMFTVDHAGSAVISGPTAKRDAAYFGSEP